MREIYEILLRRSTKTNLPGPMLRYSHSRLYSA